MPYGRSKDQFLLKEGTVQIGTWSDPHSITTAADPSSSFTASGDLGYFQQGTVNGSIARQYAEFMSGTPGVKVRKDLIRKDFMVSMQNAQVNTDLLALAQGLEVETGGTYDLAWIGPDEPTQNRNGYLWSTELVDGTPLYIAMWAGQVTSEEVGFAPSGTEHVTYELKVESFEGPTFTGNDANDQRSYGLIWLDTSSS
jgi:hypothetical protein